MQSVNFDSRGSTRHTVGAQGEALLKVRTSQNDGFSANRSIQTMKLKICIYSALLIPGTAVTKPEKTKVDFWLASVDREKETKRSVDCQLTTLDLCRTFVFSVEISGGPPWAFFVSFRKRGLTVLQPDS